MKILIADDSEVNLDAAREAAKGFKNCEFKFTNSASAALLELENVDAIITDLFFPSEEDENLLQEYRKYVELIEGVISNDGLQKPYGGSLMLKAWELHKKLVLVTDLHRHTGRYNEDHERKLDPHARAYGMSILYPLVKAGIMSEDEAGGDGAYWGKVFHESLTYMGHDVIDGTLGNITCSEDFVTIKSNPKVWSKAISLVLRQLD